MLNKSACFDVLRSAYNEVCMEGYLLGVLWIGFEF